TLPPTITACAPPASWVDTQTRAPNCVAGQFGRLEQLREGHHNYSCPEAWDAPVDSFDVTGWQPWTTTLQTCASCPAPEVETEKRWAADFTLANCPAGQYGTTAHQRDQERTRDKTYNCPAGTIVLPAPDYTSWSAWVNTGATRQVSSACTTCPPVAPQTEVQWQATAPNCPAGQYGARSWEYEQS